MRKISGPVGGGVILDWRKKDRAAAANNFYSIGEENPPSLIW